MAALISFAKPRFGTRRSQVRADPFRSAHGAIDGCLHRLAHIRDSALGGVLLLALFSIVGVRVLLLDKQLCHRWLWRHRSAADVEDLGSTGKQLNLVQAQLNERLAFVQLYQALGGGWQQ